MSDTPDHDPEMDLIAAEFALGVLGAEEMRRLRLRAATDPAFAAAVAAWQKRLSPLADELDPVQPDPALWQRIDAAVDDSPAADEVVSPLAHPAPPRRPVGLRVGLRAYAAAMTALAASLALVVGIQTLRPPPVEPPQVAQAPRLIAALAAAGEPTSLTVSYDPARREVMVLPGRLAVASARVRELWIIPRGGTPASLGVVRPGATARRTLPDALARHFDASATIALSDEPTGGSPTGQPTGAVVATAPLIAA